MRTNIARIGNFTSSNFHRLMANGKAAGSKGDPFYSYVKEKKYEHKLGRALGKEVSNRDMTWGQVCEKYVLETKLGTEYEPCSDVSIVHNKYKYWSGTPDAIKHVAVKTIAEVKCPATLLSFCQFAESTTIEDAIKNHKDANKYAWQCKSNAVLTKCTRAELIIFCPYYDELDAIIEIARQYVNDGKNEFNWLLFADKEELPYLLKAGEYSNIHKIEFEITEADIQQMEARYLEAEILLTA